MRPVIKNAELSDAESIYALLKPYSSEGIILERTLNDIRHSIDKFLTAKTGGTIAGVISYHEYGKKLKEVRSLAVKKEMSGKGIGSLLLNHLIDILIEKIPDAKIFVLTYSPEFFRKEGFSDVMKDSLPEKIWKDCNNCGNKDDCGETALVYNKGTWEK
jgi:amino-acid N-acetyltransferase